MELIPSNWRERFAAILCLPLAGVLTWMESPWKITVVLLVSVCVLLKISGPSN
jgi:hypothetical protein